MRLKLEPHQSVRLRLALQLRNERVKRLNMLAARAVAAREKLHALEAELNGLQRQIGEDLDNEVVAVIREHKQESKWCPTSMVVIKGPDSSPEELEWEPPLPANGQGSSEA